MSRTWYVMLLYCGQVAFGHLRGGTLNIFVLISERWRRVGVVGRVARTCQYIVVYKYLYVKLILHAYSMTCWEIIPG